MLPSLRRKSLGPMMPDGIIEQHDERQPDPRAFFVTHHLSSPGDSGNSESNHLLPLRVEWHGSLCSSPCAQTPIPFNYHSSFHFNHLIILSHPSALVAPIQAILSKHSFVQYL